MFNKATDSQDDQRVLAQHSIGPPILIISERFAEGLAVRDAASVLPQQNRAFYMQVLWRLPPRSYVDT